MATKPKPFRTRHRNLNDDAISKLSKARNLMVALMGRHIPPRDELGMKLADEIITLALSTLADLEEERRIMDAGIDVKAVEQHMDELTTHATRVESEIHKLRNLLHNLSIRQELLEERLTDTGIPIELPKLNAKRNHP